MHSLCRSCFLVLASSAVIAGPIDSGGLYDITTETSMPHLEENLRYAIARGQHCLSRDDLASVFPVLRHPALAGCQLREQNHDGDTLSYLLVCGGSSGTTGTAKWRLGEHIIRGSLDVKLGGKNMTFSQRITGTLIGACLPTSELADSPPAG